jgi:hypothetical protein
MIALPVLPGCVHAPNELGEQMRESLLMTLGKPLKDRQGNGRHKALLDGWLTLFARHGFPP